MAELSDSLLHFIQICIPTYQAAEVLLFLAAHPERAFEPEEIVVDMRPVVVTLPAVREYGVLFTTTGVIVDEGGRLKYGPATAELEQRTGELAHAYNERPVSLIRAIYHISDNKIRLFADAFNLRKE